MHGALGPRKASGSLLRRLQSTAPSFWPYKPVSAAPRLRAPQQRQIFIVRWLMAFGDWLEDCLSSGDLFLEIIGTIVGMFAIVIGIAVILAILGLIVAAFSSLSDFLPKPPGYPYPSAHSPAHSTLQPT